MRPLRRSLLSLTLAAVLASPAGFAVTAQRDILPAGTTPDYYQLVIDPDLTTLTFNGQMTVDFTASEPLTDLQLNALDLTIQSASLDGQTVKTRVDNDKQRVYFATPIKPGKHQLVVQYQGKIYEQSAGLFVTDYNKPDGSKGRMLSSQFEPGDARKLAPMWDEPSHKARFAISIVEPKGQTAISNMPEQSRQPLPDGRVRVSFAPSVKMSSYLLYVGSGEYDRLSGRSGGIEHSVIAKRGDGGKGQFALESSYQLLDYYNDYFGIRYPLPKLDHIAVPGAGGFGAMENWGAVMYFEDTLLLDPQFGTVYDKQNVFTVVAHEMAHQWFGNIVTMQWWDDLWLNEGFASWMESKATQHFYSEWLPELSAVSSRNYAMLQDAQQTTHPIVQQVNNLAEANAAFDGITYSKGLSVITMIEAYLGAQDFRAGVRAYMQKHQYHNTVTADLWQALSQASGKPVSKIAADFTMQPGVPLILAEQSECRSGNTKVTVRQQRFGLDEPSKQQLDWTVPMVAQVAGQAAVRAEVRGDKPQVLELPGCGAVQLNAGQTGYYRVQYSNELQQQLQQAFTKLSPVDQFGLLSDASALSAAGYADVASYLALADQLDTEANPLILQEFVQQLSVYADWFTDQTGEVAFKQWATTKAQALLKRTGVDKVAGEPDTVAMLRTSLISVLAELGDEQVITMARERFNASLTDKKALSGEMYSVVVGIVGHYARPEDFAKLQQLAKQTSNSSELRRLLMALAAAKDEQLAKQALALSLTELTPKQLAPNVLNRVSQQHPQLAYDFYQANKAAVDDSLDPLRRDGFDAGLLDSARSTQIAGLLKTKAEQAQSKPVKLAYQQAAAAVERRLDRISRIPAQINQWLQKTAP